VTAYREPSRAAAQQWHRIDGWRLERLLLAEEGVIGFPALLRVTPRLTWDRCQPDGALGHRDRTEWAAEVTVMFSGDRNATGSSYAEAAQTFSDVDEARAWAEAAAVRLADARARAAALQLVEQMMRVERERKFRESMETPWNPPF
jgi:hypothetical protein